MNLEIFITLAWSLFGIVLWAHFHDFHNFEFNTKNRRHWIVGVLFGPIYWACGFIFFLVAGMGTLTSKIDCWLQGG